jgi:uncharacterized membrane protein
MIDLIYVFQFIHLIAATAMLGVWFAAALFMGFAHRSANTSVVALTASFVVKVELLVVAPAMAVTPLIGVPLAWAIGLSPLDEFWIVLSIAIYLLVLAAWLAALWLEFRIRDLTRKAALASRPLGDDYRRLFRFYAALTWPALVGVVVLFALMIWQPRWS